MSDLLANSYRDFHAKGLDYLCLRRSPAETVKVYFFEGEVSHAPEVVAPHDHRYPFNTVVLAGELTNYRYRQARAIEAGAKTYERFTYMTPLNGGDGFAWEAVDSLVNHNTTVYAPGSRHSHLAENLHTISVKPGTVIALQQFGDVVPLDQPTRTWRPEGMRDPPSLSGLYRPMDEDRLFALVNTYFTLTGRPPPVVSND